MTSLHTCRARLLAHSTQRVKDARLPCCMRGGPELPVKAYLIACDLCLYMYRLREADGAGKVLQLEFNGAYYLCELSILVGEGGRPPVAASGAPGPCSPRLLHASRLLISPRREKSHQPLVRAPVTRGDMMTVFMTCCPSLCRPGAARRARATSPSSPSQPTRAASSLG